MKIYFNDMASGQEKLRWNNEGVGFANSRTEKKTFCIKPWSEREE